MLCENGRSSDEAPPAMIQDAVAAAIEDGTTMDEIVARIRVGDGDGSPSAADRIAERLDGLIHMLREADRCAEEWVRTREPGTESRASLVAIEALRTLAQVKMADLGARAEPVPAEDLARLALALFRDTESRASLVARPCARWPRSRWPTSARARSRCRRRTSPVSRSRCSASKAPTGSASNVSGRWPRLTRTPNRPLHPGPVCRGTKRSAPSAGPSGSISSPNARTHRRQRAAGCMGRPALVRRNPTYPT